MKYWINTVSRDHVIIGVEQGIVQANHGKLAPLKRLNKEDRILYYSPKTSLKSGTSLKAFTAIATVSDDNIYQVVLSADFKPFRRKAEYENCNEVNIEPLIAKLDFIKNKKSWGYMFRFGLFEISEQDFNLIYDKMKL
jgi:predicted RNA-binding protein